jgi:hypothetical protein
MKTQFKTLTLSLLFTAAFSLITRAQTGYIVHDLTTGVVNGTTTPISYGSVDDTWQLALPATPNTYANPVVCTNPVAWDVESCGRWITNKLALGGYNPHPNAAAGTYRYKTTFNMSHHCIPWAKMNFSYIGGDNMLVGILINGNVYSITPGSADDYTSLAQNVVINIDPNHILLGQNVITILVDNSAIGYTGFYACGNVSIGYCPMPGGSTGILENDALNASAFTISPNPTTGKFSFVMQKPADGKVDIIDLMGRKVRSFNLNGDVSHYLIDLSSSPKGIYTLLIHAGKTIETRRIVLE